MYRDDNLGYMRGTDRSIGIKLAALEKKLHQLFGKNDFKITITSGIQIVNFLDVTLNLANGTIRPHRKDDEVPLYVHQKSNHPPQVKKELPKMINKRVSDLCSSEEIFNQEKGIYEAALRNSGYDYEMKYEPENPDQGNKKKRKPRDILWYIPPWNDNCLTPVKYLFNNLIDKHFPRGSQFYVFFNRQKVRATYSTTSNMWGKIAGNNKKLLNPEDSLELKGCNCQGAAGPANCTMSGHCQTSNIVYQGDLDYKQPNPFTGNEEKFRKTYIGSCCTTWKRRYGNHKQSFSNPQANQTALSTEIWRLKGLNNTNFQLSWSIKKLARPYSRESKFCHLCLAEKTCILYMDKSTAINKKSELHGHCPHWLKHRLCSW